MTTPTGTISMTHVATELGVTVTGMNLNQANVRTLAGVASGAISMNNLRGKSAAPAYDYVPNAVNWGDIYVTGSYGDQYGYGETANQTISGINTPITLRITGTSMVLYGDPFGYYGSFDLFKNNVYVDSIPFDQFMPSTAYLDITVSNGDTLKFGMGVATSPSGSWPPDNATVQGSGTFTIRNLSSSSTVLDTFEVVVSGSGPNY